MNQTSTSALLRLFSRRSANVFAVLDGASVPDLQDKLYEHQPEFECLYRGELEPDLAEVAPYLVLLEPRSVFSNWVVEEGWGNHWGIFATSNAKLEDMRRHFRLFLTVHNSDGTPLYFRYYDPRVLPVYLRSCNSKELQDVFGPVLEYHLESDEVRVMLCFRSDGGTLVSERVLLAT